MELQLSGDRQIDEITDAEALVLLEKRSKWPSPEYVADRLARRARRVAAGIPRSALTLPEVWGEMLPMGGGASYVDVVLDTTAPASPSISLNSGDLSTGSQLVTATIATTDPDTTGYQILVYGDVDTTNDSNVQATAGASTWFGYTGSLAVKLSSGDGSKTVRLKIRDDVWNATSEVTDSITLDTVAPTVTVQSGPTPARISKVSGKDETTIVWQSDQQYDEYIVKAVPSTASIHTAGTAIPTTAGSTNVGGTTPDQPAATDVTTVVKGADLETASSGDGTKHIKIFVKDDNGNWSP